MALRHDGQETSSEWRRVGEAEMASFEKSASACRAPSFYYMWWRERMQVGSEFGFHSSCVTGGNNDLMSFLQQLRWQQRCSYDIPFQQRILWIVMPLWGIWEAYRCCWHGSLVLGQHTQGLQDFWYDNQIQHYCFLSPESTLAAGTTYITEEGNAQGQKAGWKCIVEVFFGLFWFSVKSKGTVNV